MTELSNEQINRALHEAMGKGCWHESDDTERATVRCKHCGDGFGGGLWERANPDYSASLDAVAEVEAWLFTFDPTCKLAERYVIALCKEVGIDTARWERIGPGGWRTVLISLEDAYCLSTATAEQRARAALSASEDADAG